jgi:5-methylcytosine-specific restriction endonuclease McrA
MPILSRKAKPLTLEEGERILERDRYQCRYCGLDGLAGFENSLIMSVDFVVPRARKGKKEAANLVTSCRPCNVIKGNRVFGSLEEAKAFVLQKREDLRSKWADKAARIQTKAAKA